MDSDTQAVRTFLIAMQPVRDALGSLVRCLYERPEVKLVSAYNPQIVSSPDLGVSAELRNGAVVDFWIELKSEDAVWHMDYSVQRHDPDEDGSHSELDFPTQTIHSVSDMPHTLLTAIHRLEEASANKVFYR